MLKSTIVASILVLAAQTASASFAPVPMGSDEYPSGPVHRSKTTATKKKDAQKHEIEVKVKAERDLAERERNVIVRRIGPGGGEGGERDVIVKRIGPGGPGEEKEMRVRVLRDAEGPEGGKPKVHIFKHGEGMGEWHEEGQHGDGHDAPHVFFFGEPREGERKIEIELEDGEGGPHHFDGHKLPPKVREHIHELIENHMRHMDGGHPGHGEGHRPPHGPRAQRQAPRSQGGPGGPGMPGPGMRRGGPGRGGPGMMPGGPGMGGFGGPRGMGPMGQGMAPGAGPGPQRRMGPGGMGGMGQRFFNRPAPAPQGGGEPGAGAAPPAPPAAPGASGRGGVNREEMRKMMIERLEKRLEELKKSEGKPQGSLINPNEFI